MTRIVLHAGMPKAGSSSIQKWLRDHASTLPRHGFRLIVAPRSESGEIAFVPYERGGVNSGWMFDGAVAKPAEAQQGIIDAFVEALDVAAERFGDVVASSESFSLPFWTLHAPTLVALEQLASRRQVSVAYYARPQHSSVEAAWRQWGFRSGMQPSDYVDWRAARLRYASTRDGVRELAPSLEFDPRPFHEDLLDGGDPVRDFTGRFLGIEVEEAGEWVNRGLPLEVVNVLRLAPPGMFWDGPHDNQRLDRIKPLVQELPPEGDRIALSRQVLRKYVHERFADENAKLGWEDFVPPPDGGDEIPGLEALDELWKPQASPAELSLLFRALDAAIEE